MTPGEVWTLDRGVFQQIMMQTGMQKIEEKLHFLKSVPLFSKMSNDILLRLSDALEVVSDPVSNAKCSIFYWTLIFNWSYLFIQNFPNLAPPYLIGRKMIYIFSTAAGQFSTFRSILQ